MTEPTSITAPGPLETGLAISRPDELPSDRGHERKRLRAALATLALLVPALTLVALWAHQARGRLDAKVQQSLHATDRLSRLSDAISAHTAAFAGDLLVRDLDSLERVRSTRTTASELRAAVARDAFPDPAKRALAAQLQEQLDDLHARMDGLSELLRGAGPAAAHERFRGGETTYRMAEVNESLAAMRRHEERTYLAQAASMQWREHWLTLALGAALSLQLALGALLYRVLRSACGHGPRTGGLL